MNGHPVRRRWKPIDLSEALDQRAGQLDRLLEGFAALERDAVLVERERIEISFCVDYYDLHHYLDLIDELRSAERRDIRAVDDYVRILLFQHFPGPLVLLPWHYGELRARIRKMVADAGSGGADLWVTKLIRTIEDEMASTEGTFGYIAAVVDGKARLDVARLDSMVRRWLGNVKDLVARMDQAQRAGAFMQRFETLFKERRLQGIKHLIGDNEVWHFESTDVAVYAKRLLDEKRSLAKQLPNVTDASAIAMIESLNERHVKEKRLFYLISSAPFMRTLVDAVNADVLAERGRELQLRDLFYWRLWFSIVLRSDETWPSLEEIKVIRNGVEPIVRDLATRCDQLRARMRQLRDESLGAVRDDVVVFLEDLDDSLARVAQPILDESWMLTLAEDALVGVPAAAEIVRTIQEVDRLLAQIRRDETGLSVLQEQLRRLLERLYHLLLRVEAECSEAVSRLNAADGHFLAGWLSGEAEMREPFGTLLKSLELKRLDGAGEVLAELSKIPSSERGPEAAVILARAYLLEGNVVSAQQELDRLDPSERRSPHVLLTYALLQRENGDLVAAEGGLRRLLSVREDAAVRLHLALVLKRRFERNRDERDRDAALTNAKLAYEKSGANASFGVHVESALAFYDLVLMSEHLKSDQISHGQIELTELLRTAESFQVGSELRRSIEQRLGRLVAAAHS